MSIELRPTPTTLCPLCGKRPISTSLGFCSWCDATQGEDPRELFEALEAKRKEHEAMNIKPHALTLSDFIGFSHETHIGAATTADGRRKRLISVAFPATFEFIFRVIVDNEKILETDDFDRAILKYNEAN